MSWDDFGITPKPAAPVKAPKSDDRPKPKNPIKEPSPYRDLLLEAVMMLERVSPLKMLNGRGRYTGRQIRKLVKRIRGCLE